jgi:hypothetical protein
MSIRGACGVVFAAAVLTLGGVPGREHAVVGGAGQQVERLESRVAAHPADSASRIELARAYLDLSSPGLAWNALAEASDAQRQEPAVQHMAARVLIEQGQAREALALEQGVLSACGQDLPDRRAHAPGCDFWLVVSAARRASILQELVKQGVEDAIAQPEASLVAYHEATHEARLAVAE